LYCFFVEQFGRGWAAGKKEDGTGAHPLVFNKKKKQSRQGGTDCFSRHPNVKEGGLQLD
jgi:hypothetical protein